ncbi:hypothetical protein [Halorubrum vacuolatum]|uniref:hypothetical protein n=1 Tax=Halorubrum vacuolatum TaxID=63740 RepID=UPI0015C613FA|nr:hypothetical protein [Halorubrum vacuolatum]
MNRSAALTGDAPGVCEGPWGDSRRWSDGRQRIGDRRIGGEQRYGTAARSSAHRRRL